MTQAEENARLAQLHRELVHEYLHEIRRAICRLTVVLERERAGMGNLESSGELLDEARRLMLHREVPLHSEPACEPCPDPSID